MTTTPMSTIILLLVEDDSILQGLLEIALSDEGFEVVLAISGSQAIAQLDAKGARFKGLITDIRLGAGPNGWDVGHRAREVFTGIPVVYMSGDSAQEWSANGVPESIMVKKPFVTAQLITAITTLLNQASSAAALCDAMKHDTAPKAKG
ncbi:response regulator [Falsiroseomonas sp. E2-1-a20]|uniref:response regulator n=1 Tax=Falsiroseomonas sp. E2-1-a20 TaxID=3239300 RepID=UPI003F411647